MTTVKPSTVGMEAIRCYDCDKLLGYTDGRVSIKCSRCGAINIYVITCAPKGVELLLTNR